MVQLKILIYQFLRRIFVVPKLNYCIANVNDHASTQRLAANNVKYRVRSLLERLQKIKFPEVVII